MSQYCQPQDVRNLFTNTNQSLVDAQIVPLIIQASGWVEAHTQRVLAQATYTEYVQLQLDRYYRLVIRCSQWPIQSVSAISYKTLGSSGYTALDVTQVDIYHPPDRFIYYVGSLAVPSGAPSGYYGTRLSRSIPGTVQVTYVAGFTPPYPQDLVLATALLTQELLGQDANPLGASTLQISAEGAQQTIAFGDEGKLAKRAKKILDQSYTRRI